MTNTINAQEWLKRNYSTDQIKNLTKLKISDKNLNGSLILEGLSKLKELDCSDNDLTSLNVSGCLELTHLNANNNQLCNMILPKNNERLEYLNLLNNDFPKQELYCFSRFINLKELHIGNIDTVNHFYGSLKPLKDLTKLEQLSINNTNIDSGLEYLPNSIKNLRCSANIPDAKVKKIFDQLRFFAINEINAFQGKYNLKEWKDNWMEKLENLEKEKEYLHKLIGEILSEYDSLNVQQLELERERSNLLAKQRELEIKKFQSDQEVIFLKIQINNLEVKFEKTKKELNEKEERLKDLEVKLEQTKKELNEKEVKLKSFTDKQLKKLQKEVNTFKDVLTLKEKFKAQLEEQIDEFNQKLETKKEEIENLNNQLDEVNSSMNNIKIKKKGLKELKEGLKKKGKSITVVIDNPIKELDLELKAKQKQHKKVNDNIKKAKKDETALQNENVRLKILSEKLHEEMQNSQVGFANLEIQLKEQNFFIEEFKKNEEVLKKRLQENVQISQEKQQQIDKLYNELEEARKHDEFLQKSLQENEQNFQGRLANLETQLEVKQKQTDELNSKLEEAKKHDETLQKEKEHLLKELQEDEQNFQTGFANLKIQLEEKQKQIDELNNKLKEARKNDESLQKEKAHFLKGSQENETNSKNLEIQLKRFESQQTLEKWIEGSNSDEHIKHYEYKNFNNIKMISAGRLSKVYCANWKIADKIFVLKSFNLENHIVIKEIYNEVNMRRRLYLFFAQNSNLYFCHIA